MRGLLGLGKSRVLPCTRFRHHSNGAVGAQFQYGILPQIPRDGIPATELDVCAGGGPGNEPGSELLSSRPLCCDQKGQCSPPNGSPSLPPWPRARTPFRFHHLRAAVLKTGGKSSWAGLGPESSHLPAWVSSPGSESGPAALRPPGRQVCCCHCPRGPGTVSLMLWMAP